MILQDGTFRQLRDFIYDKCGIYVPDTKKYLLEKKIGARVQARNLGSFEDYLVLARSAQSGDELSKLFDAVTTNETYFFRETQQFDVLLDNIVPAIIEKRPAKDIKIWSAACSSGEEPYPISLLLAEKKAGLRPEILASDISEEVLATARKAVFGSYSIRNVPPACLQKYFKDSGWAMELIPAIRAPVKFLNVNLIDDKKIRTIRDVDVIFCRNVLIYFDDKAKQKVVSNLYDSLRPGGYLFIGSSESLHNVTRAFRPLTYNKVVVYQKV
jgi:chemotaxis protein methyltransferase CheR